MNKLVVNFIAMVLATVVVNAQYHQPGVQQQQQQPYMGQPQHGHPNQAAYGQPPMGQPQVPVGGNPNLLHDKARIQDREHIKEHLHGVLGEPDVSKMSEEELQFHYFKMHDNDNNNKLDGCELIKSLIHWHGEYMQVI